MSARTGLLLVLMISGAVLIYTVTARLSEQTIDVVVGLLCGVVASVPVSVGLLIALTRRHRDRIVEEEEAGGDPEPVAPYAGYQSRHPYPPVIVITPQQGQLPGPYAGLLPPGAMPFGYDMNEPPTARDFKIIGEDDDDVDA
jgi:hypothetical protein